MSVSMFESCARHSKPDGSGKFPTRKAAQAALALRRAQGGLRKGAPHAFKCKAGNHWHIGRDARYRWRTAS